MFKASFLLLLTLLLNVQLCSSAPIPSGVVQSPAVAEEPGHHSDSIEKIPNQEKLIPVAAGEAAPSPEEPPAEEDIPVIAKEPESVFIGDQVSVDDDKAVSKGLETQESLAAAPQQSSEQETVSAEAAVAEASPGEATQEVAAAVAVEPESSEHHVEDPAPDPVPDDSIVVEEEPLPLTSEEEISVVLVPAEHGTEEAGQVEPVAEETATQGSAPEDPAVIVPVEPAEQGLPQEKQEETIPIILSETKDEEAPENHAKEEEKVAPVVLRENVKSDQGTNQQPLSSTSEEVLEGQVEPNAEEKVPEKLVPDEPAVIVPVEPAEQKPAQGEEQKSVSIILSEAKEEVAPEEHAKEEEKVVLPQRCSCFLGESTEMDPATNEEPLPSTSEEDESVNPSSIELEGQVEPAAETEPERSVLKETAIIAVTVTVEPAEQELDQEKQEETVPIILSGTKDEEALEEQAKEEEKVAPVVLVENTEIHQATNEEPLSSTSVEDASVTVSPVELEGQVEPNAEETASEGTASEGSVAEEPAVIVPMEPAKQEPAQEEQQETVPIILSEAKDEEPPEEHAKEEEKVAPVVLVENTEIHKATNEEPLSSTSVEDATVTVSPVELEGQVEPNAEETASEGSVTEEPAVIVPMEPAEQEPAQEAQQETVPIILSEAKDEVAPEEHAKEEEKVIPAQGCRCLLGENTIINPATNEEPLSSTLEEEESVIIITKELESEGEPTAKEAVLLESAPEDPIVPEPLPSTPEEDESDVHAELDTEDKSEEEAAAAEDTDPEKPAVVILVEPTSEEPAPDDPVLVIPLEDLERNNTEEEAVQSDPLTEEEAALEEDTSSQKNDSGDSEAETLVTSVSESPSENETIETSLDQGEEVPVDVTEVPVAKPEPVTAPAPTVTDAQEETVHTPVEGGNVTSIKTHSKDIKSAVKLIEEEPEVPLNRGAFLGAAFFTLVLFIAIGVVWTTISKKLR